MAQNVGQNIVNMLKCAQGEHILFRSFGLGNATDSTHGLGFGRISVELSRWYPDTRLKNFEVTKATESGEFEYKIDIMGV